MKTRLSFPPSALPVAEFHRQIELDFTLRQFNGFPEGIKHQQRFEAFSTHP
jgi:hypothetical protein